MTSNRDEPLWWLWPVRREVADAGSDAAPRRPWRGPATDPILYPVEFVVVYRLDRTMYYCPATPNRPNAATQVATTNVTRRISLYIDDIVNVEVTVMNGNVRASGGAKLGVDMHAPQNCTKLFNGSRGHLSLAAALTAAVPLGRAPICFSEPCDNVSRLLRCLRCCAPGTLPSAGVRCLLHTSSRFSPELPFGSAMDQQGCHGSRLRRRG